MSSTKDRVTGGANVAPGNVKQAVGKAGGSKKLEAEGVIQEAKGDAQKAVGDAEEAIKHGANKIAGVINKRL
jgi:uncharacterized protein YjbJ (UPF0337 family)